MSMEFGLFPGNFEIVNERDFLEKVRKIADDFSVNIIFFDSAAVAGTKHIETALSLAERSFYEYKTPISNFFEMEVLLYAFGTRQTGYASGFGIHKGMNDSLICICRRSEEQEAFGSFGVLLDKVSDRLRELAECRSKKLITVPKEQEEVMSDEKISLLLKIFEITPEELDVCGKDRIGEIVIERCALLDVYK